MLIKSAHRPAGNESGSALMAVLGVMAVTAIIGVTLTTATINAMGVTSSSRASVQARAAAEAGVDQALVDLQTACVSTFASTTEPDFEYALSYSMTATGTTWGTGCPPDDAERVKILSTGHASSPGVAGAGSGDTRLIEAIYDYIPVWDELPEIEAAVYAYKMEGTLQKFNLDSPGADFSADIQIKEGNVNCENNAGIDGDVILGNGFVDLKNCIVHGSIHASKYVHAYGNGTTVDGSIIALGDGVAATGNVVDVNGGSTVKGSIQAGGNVRIDSLVEGNVWAVGSATSKVVVTSTGRVKGNIVSSGTIEVQAGGSVLGTQSPGTASTAPIAPRVPGWTDIPFPPNTWTGYTVVPWVGACSVGNSHTFWEGLATRTATDGNLVIDARACGASGLNFQNNITSLILSANISFIASSFYVDKLVVDSNNATTRYLWFVVPDMLDNDAPTCTAPAGNITLTNEADIKPTIAAMAYTPCKIISDRNYWRGQLYGGSMEFLQQAELVYAPVGVPGVDFSASLTPLTVLGDPLLGARVSMREVVNGG